MSRMSSPKDMATIVDTCRKIDPSILLVIGRRKDANVICYRINNNIIEPYWRMADGSEVGASYLEKKFALNVQSKLTTCGKRQFFLVGAPHIPFSLDGLSTVHNNKVVHYVFMGERRGYFDQTPSYIIIQYTDNTSEKIYFT